MGENVTKAVNANAHTSHAAVASPPSNISGAIHGTEPSNLSRVDILNDELVRNDIPKSVRRARPSSDINTSLCKMPLQTEPRCKDKQTYPLHISMVQWARTETVQVT